MHFDLFSQQPLILIKWALLTFRLLLLLLELLFFVLAGSSRLLLKHIAKSMPFIHFLFLAFHLFSILSIFGLSSLLSLLKITFCAAIRCSWECYALEYSNQSYAFSRHRRYYQLYLRLKANRLPRTAG